MKRDPVVIIVVAMVVTVMLVVGISDGAAQFRPRASSCGPA